MKVGNLKLNPINRQSNPQTTKY